jgi:OmpA-OmpF porin, OOP family
MTRKTRLHAGAALVLVSCLPAPLLAADDYNSDRKGSADHKLVSRYEGSILYMTGEDPAAAAQVVFEEQGKPVLRPVEGRISNRLYWGPKGRSPLDVFRNYRQALEAGGFTIMYACETRKCEAERVQPLIDDFPRQAKWAEWNVFVANTFNSGSQPGFHYLSARKAAPGGGTTYVQLGLVGGFEDKPVFGRVRQFLQVIEPATIELGKVKVDAKAIQAGIERDGKIALYGVTFDTGKAVLRDESAQQLGEMAQALKAKPSLNVFIVGHTDNQGDLQANTVLSHKRAEAVIAALTGKHGIAAARLLARGVANVAPVASNDSEEGRAKNRRVEMVAR